MGDGLPVSGLSSLTGITWTPGFVSCKWPCYWIGSENLNGCRGVPGRTSDCVRGYCPGFGFSIVLMFLMDLMTLTDFPGPDGFLLLLPGFGRDHFGFRFFFLLFPP